VFRNNAAVLPARLRARRPTGGEVECLLLRPHANPASTREAWWCLVRPGRRLPIGATFSLDDAFTGTVLEKQADGTTLVEFSTVPGTTLTDIAHRHGVVPLPPYIERAEPDPAQRAADLERYQTVYADRSRAVAVAAPTAGLHFTPELLQTLETRGVQFAEVTLHVGLGTFRPIATATVDEHQIHRELYELSTATQAAIADRSRRHVAVGTTSVRALEDFAGREPARRPAPYQAEAQLFIRPPYAFRAVDALITNFHQPRSTLLCLVAAFLAPESTDGIRWLHEIYAEAIAREYRFFSYGDAMLIL
ncbi:MAG TPA: tRNA preQ1(34) S-adenosylmethionine ribosyltransferase-isomerase QueA, partial [Candidatus Synoicihabitans sp.]|nr:tRNA preQ1(34) S-adenosylmethionine ribosyltransferase-isomerase QueA [Candidatus Synoicihabitans sp.]